MAIFRITEKKRVKIEQDCVANPVYLAWIGLRGGVNYWLFGGTQTINVKTGKAKVIQKDIRDLEPAEGAVDYLKKEGAEKWQIGANNVKREDLEGLKTLLISPKVQVLMNPDTWITEGPIWQTVLVNTGSFRIIETDESRHDIKLTIDFSPINIQQN